MSNNPRVIIELSEEDAEQLVDNCDSNLEFGLKSLDKLTSRDLQEKMVATLEFFRRVKTAVKKGQGDFRG